MTRANRRAQLGRILALLLCVAIAVFFTAVLVHSHGVATSGDHAAHCQVCALGHTTASIATVITLTIALQMLMLMRAGAPTRGSPRFVVVHTTRPPPASL